MICRRVFAFSLPEASMNFGRLIASSSTKLSRSCCPPFWPSGSVTLRSLFFPLRSTTRPLSMITLSLGGIVLSALAACEGLYLFPPRAHAIASSTEDLPCLFFPPMIVSPSLLGSIITAWILFTFSISSLLIFIPVSSQKYRHKTTCTPSPVAEHSPLHMTPTLTNRPA